MQEQEIEATDAIAKWQQSGTASKEKFTELEEKLKEAIESKESMPEYFQLKEENASLQQKIEDLEGSLAENSDNRIDLETQHNDTISELQEALKTAEYTLTRDEEVVQQWEGE